MVQSVCFFKRYNMFKPKQEGQNMSIMCQISHRLGVHKSILSVFKSTGGGGSIHNNMYIVCLEQPNQRPLSLEETEFHDVVCFVKCHKVFAYFLLKCCTDTIAKVAKFTFLYNLTE